MPARKTKFTQRKFYSKWLYKTCFLIPGCVLLRNYSSFDDIKDFLQNPLDEERHYYGSLMKAHANGDVIIKLCDFLATHSKDQYALRIEQSRLDVYTNDAEFYENISHLLASSLVHRFQPHAADIDILNRSHNNIAVNKLPKDRYRYRAYLLPHKMANDREGKQKYLAWLKTQQPRLTCTESIERWFVATDWNWDRRYILVEDEATLLMLKLRNAEVLGRVYNFVISDK